MAMIFLKYCFSEINKTIRNIRWLFFMDLHPLVFQIPITDKINEHIIVLRSKYHRYNPMRHYTTFLVRLNIKKHHEFM